MDWTVFISCSTLIVLLILWKWATFKKWLICDSCSWSNQGCWSWPPQAKHPCSGLQEWLEGWGHDECGDLHQHDPVSRIREEKNYIKEKTLSSFDKSSLCSMVHPMLWKFYTLLLCKCSTNREFFFSTQLGKCQETPTRTAGCYIGLIGLCNCWQVCTKEDWMLWLNQKGASTILLLTLIN